MAKIKDLIGKLITLSFMNVFVFGLCPKPNLSNGRSDIRMKGRIIYYYCNKGFHLVGYRTAKCAHNGWNHPPPTCVASGCDVNLTISNGVVVQTLNGSVLTINCVNDTILQGRNKMYCDGQKWHIPVPKCTEPENINSCDFENGGFCGWKQDTNDEFDWLIRSGETPTARTGPVYDHTYGQGSSGGHYIYMEASAPRQPGHTTRLLSPVYPPHKSDRCLQFWFHMLGPSSRYDVGSLSLNIIHNVEFLSNVSTLWSVSGNQGKRWKVADIYIEKTNCSFQLQLEAVRQRSYVSDIAVDDILFYECVPATTVTSTEYDSTTSGSAARAASSIESVTLVTSVTVSSNEENTTSSTATRQNVWSIPQSMDPRPKSMLDILLSSEPHRTNQTNNGSSHDIIRHNLHNNPHDHLNFPLRNDSSATDDSSISNIYNVTAPEQRTTESSAEVITIPTEKAATDAKSSSYQIKSQTTVDYQGSTRMEQVFSSSSDMLSGDTSVGTSDKTFSSAVVNRKSAKSKEKGMSNNVTSPHVDFVHVEAKNRTTILNLCISLSVVSIFIAVLILFIALCRRRQRKYEKKYEEMKLFVETHYRNRYI